MPQDAWLLVGGLVAAGTGVQCTSHVQGVRPLAVGRKAWAARHEALLQGAGLGCGARGPGCEVRDPTAGSKPSAAGREALAAGRDSQGLSNLAAGRKARATGPKHLAVGRRET